MAKVTDVFLNGTIGNVHENIFGNQANEFNAKITTAFIRTESIQVFN